MIWSNEIKINWFWFSEHGDLIIKKMWLEEHDWNDWRHINWREVVSSICVLIITNNCKHKLKFCLSKLKNLLSRQNSSFGFKTRVLVLIESCSLSIKMAKLKFPWGNSSFETYREHLVFHFKTNSSFSLKTRVLDYTETTCCFLKKAKLESCFWNSSFGYIESL